MSVWQHPVKKGDLRLEENVKAGQPALVSKQNAPTRARKQKGKKQTAHVFTALKEKPTKPVHTTFALKSDKKKGKRQKQFTVPTALAKGKLLTVTVSLPKRNVEMLLARLSAKKIPVLRLNIGEKEIKLKVRAQDYPLAFAIFTRMCYTVNKQKVGGAFSLLIHAVKRMGVTLGIFLFFTLSVYTRPVVLEINYRGTAAFRKEEMQAVLRESGVAPFCRVQGETLQRAERNLLTAFPSLWFVSLEKRGFYLTVTAEAAPLFIQKETCYLLTSTQAGVVYSITVLQGVPLVAVGESVSPGQALVRGEILSGTGEEVSSIPAPVICEVVLCCAYSEQRVYASESPALLTLLQQNALKSVGAHAPKTDNSRIECVDGEYRYCVEFTYLSALVGGNPWKRKEEG